MKVIHITQTEGIIETQDFILLLVWLHAWHPKFVNMIKVKTNFSSQGGRPASTLIYWLYLTKQPNRTDKGQKILLTTYKISRQGGNIHQIRYEKSRTNLQGMQHAEMANAIRTFLWNRKCVHWLPLAFLG